jgi:hypothetical protein
MDPQEFLCASGVPEKSQSEQDQPGYTWISFYVLQVSLKSHNLDRTNMDTEHMDPHEFRFASGFPEESQSRQEQPAWVHTWFPMCYHNLDRTNLDTQGFS